MTAAEVIKLIQTMEPPEIERLFVLIKEYEAEVRRRQTVVRHGSVDENFERAADMVFAENKELFQMLAKLEREERAAKDSSPKTA